MKNKKISSQFIYSKESITLINTSREKNIWNPINFYWKPILELNKEMKQKL